MDNNQPSAWDGATPVTLSPLALKLLHLLGYMDKVSKHMVPVESHAELLAPVFDCPAEQITQAVVELSEKGMIYTDKPN
jgi:hypothetical protein